MNETRDVPVVFSAAGHVHCKAHPEDMERFARAAGSFREFLRYWQFLDQDTGVIRTLGEELWPGQEAFISETELVKWIMALKARQLGYTTIECAYDAWAARFRDGATNTRVHLFSKKDDDAIGLLTRIKFGLDRLPDYMQLPMPASLVQTAHEIHLYAGKDDVRTIKAHATGENPSRGDTCNHAHVDEWAAMTNPAKAWQAIEPTLAGSCHLITTGDGPNNWTSGFWRRCLAGDAVDRRGDKISAFFTSALNRPDRNDRWLADKRRSMGDDTAFFHEYAMKWEDALYGGGEFTFRSRDCDAASVDCRGLSDPRPGRRYVTAWDIGRHKDAAVGIVLDVTEDVHDVVAYKRLRQNTYPMIQREIQATHVEYPGLTVIEDNAAGEAVRENLELAAHEVEGFKTTAPSKARIIAALNVSLQAQTMKWDAEACEQLDSEMRGYQIPDDGVVQDSVMALAIAEEFAAKAHLKIGKVGTVMNV